jgi:transcriptional regulator with XRE-family HTH domain
MSDDVSATTAARVGQRIRQLRVASGLSQTALGNRCGLTFQQIQKYESGKSRIAVDRLLQIADALDTSVLVFMSDLEGRSAPEPEAEVTKKHRQALELLRHFHNIGADRMRGALVNLAKQVSHAANDDGAPANHQAVTAGLAPAPGARETEDA